MVQKSLMIDLSSTITLLLRTAVPGGKEGDERLKRAVTAGATIPPITSPQIHTSLTIEQYDKDNVTGKKSRICILLTNRHASPKSIRSCEKEGKRV